MTGRDASYTTDMKDLSTVVVSQDDREIQGFIEVTTQSMALCWILFWF